MAELSHHLALHNMRPESPFAADLNGDGVKTISMANAGTLTLIYSILVLACALVG
jgi:hypothetical protein